MPVIISLSSILAHVPPTPGQPRQKNPRDSDDSQSASSAGSRDSRSGLQPGRAGARPPARHAGQPGQAMARPALGYGAVLTAARRFVPGASTSSRTVAAPVPSPHSTGGRPGCASVDGSAATDTNTDSESRTAVRRDSGSDGPVTVTTTTNQGHAARIKGRDRPAAVTPTVTPGGFPQPRVRSREGPRRKLPPRGGQGSLSGHVGRCSPFRAAHARGLSGGQRSAPGSRLHHRRPLPSSRSAPGDGA